MKQNWAHFGFSRATALLPRLDLGKPLSNAERLIPLFETASLGGASVVSTSELALTGYTCEDWFHSETLIQESETALLKILKASEKFTSLWLVGAPLRLMDGRLFNGAFALSHGKILGFVPKTYLPNMGEFYERRWFVSGRNLNEEVHHPRLGNFFASSKQIFAGGPLRVGVEICQDLWAPEALSTGLALSGASVIVNLSASNEVLQKAKLRKELVLVQSKKLHCAYLYTSSGMGESSKDTVFSGHTFAYELGELLSELAPFDLTSEDLFNVDFDVERILNSRSKDVCFLESVDERTGPAYRFSAFQMNSKPLQNLQRVVSSHPFLDEVDEANSVLEIQSQGLLRRLESSKSKSMIIGISGGLDSTLALLVSEKVRELSHQEFKIIGVTLPGPGTSDTTLAISRSLLKEVKVDQSLEVSIGDSVQQHLKDLGKSSSDRSVVFENAQARERTQILFDLANEHRGIVVGTGDLSELALGWCTFNADHMAHYAVNSGIPKTVVKLVLSEIAKTHSSQELRLLLSQILALPISPELLPPDENGKIAQETEALIGSYDLHDFYLYHFLKHGFSKEKIKALAEVAFQSLPEMKSQIDASIEIFFQRFFSQQFKRTTLPPGPKVHSVGLSPRSDFRFPDELSS